MFCLYKYGIAVMDRKSFGVIGHKGKHYFRLSIANKLSELEEGIARLDKACHD